MAHLCSSASSCPSSPTAVVPPTSSGCAHSLRKLRLQGVLGKQCEAGCGVQWGAALLCIQRPRLMGPGYSESGDLFLHLV